VIRIRRNFWVVVGLLAASIFAAAVWGSAIYYRLIYVWVFLLLSSWVWTLVSLRGVDVVRYARTNRQQVGQVFEERFEIENHANLPHLWIAIRDRSTLPGAAGSRVITWIGGNQQRSYLTYSWLTRRGLFALGPTQISSGDLFGLFSATMDIDSPQSLLVTPFLIELLSFPSPVGILPGGPTLHQKTLEVTPYAAGVREYVPGDSLNRIHWPTTARRDRLMVKEFEQDPQADVWIFIDAHKFVQAALPEAIPILKADSIMLWRHKPEEVRLPSATMEYSISAAASIAHYFINQGHAVGMASAGQTYSVLPAERGERQLGKILENLAFLEGEGDLSILGLVTAQAGFLPRGCTVVLITPSILPEVGMAVDDLQRRSMHPVVVEINPASFGGAMGAGETIASIQARNVPALQVNNRDDLRVALEAGSIRPFDSSPWRETPEA
jgi:uncharacterized protein (DUF58 family)